MAPELVALAVLRCTDAWTSARRCTMRRPQTTHEVYQDKMLNACKHPDEVAQFFAALSCHDVHHDRVSSPTLATLPLDACTPTNVCVGLTLVGRYRTAPSAGSREAAPSAGRPCYAR